MSIQWRPFALRPQFESAPFRFQDSYVENAWRKASALAEPDGLTYTMWPHDDFPRWSMPGLEAGAAAQQQGEGLFLRFHTELYRSFFIENKSLIEKETFVTVARSSGLDMTRFLRDIEDKAFQDQVREQCADAADTYFVSAVPTVLIGGKTRQIGMVPATTYLQDLARLGLE